MYTDRRSRRRAPLNAIEDNRMKRAAGVFGLFVYGLWRCAWGLWLPSQGNLNESNVRRNGPPDRFQMFGHTPYRWVWCKTAGQEIRFDNRRAVALAGALLPISPGCTGVRR
jgi:hypothetical protein